MARETTTAASGGLVFLGDSALPGERDPVLVGFEDWPALPSVANLEGALLEHDRVLPNGMHNGPAALRLMRRFGTVAVSIANNHALDAGLAPSALSARLEAAGIESTGAGDDARAAAQPALLRHAGREWCLLGFGWEAIGCRGSRATHGVINPLRPRHALDAVARWRSERPQATLVVLAHWGYELDPHPQPLHRELARELVDAGADAVIGCHSHLAQGLELHRGAPIAYGLGNWLIPNGLFYGGRLSYPAIARRSLALEWEPGQEPICHWLDSDVEAGAPVLRYLGSEPAAASAELNRLTPFAGLDASSYRRWFRRHRRKRAGLPVYDDPHATWRNRLKDAQVRARGALLACAFRLGLKGGPR